MAQTIHNLTFDNVDETLTSLAKIVESSNLQQGDKILIYINKNSDHEALIETLVHEGVVYPG